MQATNEAVDHRAAALGYQLFDADNHYYEPEDAFLRYMDPRIAHKAPRWVQVVDGGAKRLVFGDRLNRFFGADHTFSMVGPAGFLSQGQAGEVSKRKPELRPPSPEYRDRDARLAVMNRQGLEATLLFPSFGVSVEQLVADDVEATYAHLHAFNRWLDDDWGFDYRDRIYGVPLLSLLDPFLAVEELEFVVARGARVVHLRPGPVAGRSPADRLFDRFWTAVTEADVAVAFHACDAPYRHDLARIWGWGNVNVPARNIPPLQRVIAGLDRTIHDTVASLVYGKLFERFPTLRLATIELGCAWVPELCRNFDRAGRGDLAEDPIDTFRRHVWVAPFDHEDLAGLAAAIGTNRVLFGSDFPHTDGLAEPASYADALKDFEDETVRKIMHDNARELVRAPGR
jgi:predicted TIM-barrel fold metal-dependent hydrolase